MKRRLISSALLSASLFLVLFSPSVTTTNYIAVGQKLPDQSIIVLSEDVTNPGVVGRGIAEQKIPNQYIVVFRDDVKDPGAAAKDIAQKHGLALGLVYEHALKGFSAIIPPPALNKVKSDARVSFVEQDQLVEAFLHTNNFETLTTGIDRIDADLNPRTDVSGVGIAIIDTGIWLTHVDLNAKAGKNCVSPSKSPNDDNGHGTHVAGIAAAKTKDSKGVRGVAPNAALWAVKVLDRNGSGPMSAVICGVDWVTANAAAKGIKVANMSLGCLCSSAALDTAIAKSVAAGVTYAVAAGNSSTNAASFSPANHPDVITVSAMGDSNGKCGGQGPNTSDGADDTFATFSNFGSLVEIAAPGVDITSTWKGDKNNPGGLYATASGTSMSAPHVAGAAAQYIASNPTATPAGVRSALIAAGVPQGQTCINGGNGGFTGDPDGIAEPLVYAP